MSYARDLIPAELWNRLSVVLPPEGSEHEESCPVSFAGGGQCRCYRAPLVAAVREVIAGLIFTDYSAPIPAKAPDPIPAEISARVVRAHEAVSAAALDNSRGYPAYKRALAAARRELSAAYKAAYEHTAAGTAPSFAFADAAREVAERAYENEADAADVESRGQA